MSTLYIIRHGQTEGNAGKPRLDYENFLTALGRAQATEAGRTLLAANARVRSFFVSDMIRAEQTADLVKKNAGIDVPRESAPDMREIFFWHKLDYVDRDEVEREFKLATYKSFRDDICKPSTKIGETQLQVYQRVGRFFEEKIIPALAKGDVVVVGHKVSNAALIAHIRDGKPDTMPFKDLKNGEVVSIPEAEARARYVAQRVPQLPRTTMHLQNARFVTPPRN